MAGLEIYALGSNGSGQLGIGHVDDVDTPRKCIFVVEAGQIQSAGPRVGEEEGEIVGGAIEIGDIKKIVAGGNHTLALTETGRLFGTGRCGLVDEDETLPSNISMSTTVFTEISRLVRGYAGSPDDEGEKITDVAATWEASFAVLGGKIFCYGTGMKGELGLGPPSTSKNDSTNSRTLRTILDIEKSGENRDVRIVAIEAGMAHAVALLSSGHVYGWGASRKGQLGEQFKEQKNVWWPERVDVGVEGTPVLPFAPERVVLGREYTVFLKTAERPVVWGSSLLADCEGNEEWVLGPDDVVVSGWSSIHLLRPPLGTVNSAGRNNHGQHAPANMPAVRGLAAGSEHCAAVTQDNQVIAWGWGEHGNCGDQVDDRGRVLAPWNVIRLPELGNGVVVKDVVAGCATTFVVCGTEEG